MFFVKSNLFVASTTFLVFSIVTLYIAGGLQQWWFYNEKITLGLLFSLSVLVIFRSVALRTESLWYNLIMVASLMLLPFLLVRLFIVEPFNVHSNSMAPSLKEGDVLLVGKLDSRWQRGDMIVFKDPQDSQAYMVKRLIAVPGDEILVDSILKNKNLVCNQKEKTTTCTLGDNDYWVIGDNLNDSIDSRDFGPIPNSSIIGRVIQIQP